MEKGESVEQAEGETGMTLAEESIRESEPRPERAREMVGARERGSEGD